MLSDVLPLQQTVLGCSCACSLSCNKLQTRKLVYAVEDCALGRNDVANDVAHLRIR